MEVTGSVARGTAIEGQSDLDLLVLNVQCNAQQREGMNRIITQNLNKLTSNNYTPQVKREVLSYKSAAPESFPNIDVVFGKCGPVC